jgi:hypothetical protein
MVKNRARGPKKPKKYGISRKLRRAARTGDSAKLAYHKKRAYSRMVKALGNAPPKMKRKAPKGWVKASAVKISRKNGRVEVLIRK